MRILLDECVDESFRHHFANDDCQTCRFAGFGGFGNGKLLAAAENAGFQVLITVYQNLPHQQSIAQRALSIIVLRAKTTDIDDLIPLLPAISGALATIIPGQVLKLGP